MQLVHDETGAKRNQTSPESTAKQQVPHERPCPVTACQTATLLVSVVLCMKAGALLQKAGSQAATLPHSMSGWGDPPVRKPRTTNSTGKTAHFLMTDTLGSGVLSRALGVMCCVCCIHHALVWFSTCP